MNYGVTKRTLQLIGSKLKDYFRRCARTNDNPTHKKGLKLMSEVVYTFTLADVVKLYGMPSDWKCFMTGDPIDVTQPSTYSFDHPLPVMRGGQSTLDNFTICSKRVNETKSDLTPEEYLTLCKKVLEHNGFQVIGRDLTADVPQRAVVGKRTHKATTSNPIQTYLFGLFDESPKTTE
jgi:hypothetical protein